MEGKAEDGVKEIQNRSVSAGAKARKSSTVRVTDQPHLLREILHGSVNGEQWG